jgi:hygromycin-B 7''-O-kinase
MSNDAVSAATAARIGRELGVREAPVRFASGSVPVYALGDRYVVKLFPLPEREYFETEVAALSAIDGGLCLPTPRIVTTDTGEHGWALVMTRLRGRALHEAWPEIGALERRRLVREVGTALAELHRVATESPQLSMDWGRFLAGQQAGCRERQRSKGLPEPWLGQIDAFLDRWLPRDDGRRVLLHTEVMREHLLVEREAGFRLTGLVDFEPAMLGAPGYELASAGLFVSCAEPGLFRELLLGYGAALDPDLPMVTMAYALLHRYSNLPWYFERLPASVPPGDFAALAQAWFSLEAGL